MATSLSLKEYLKRYESGADDPNKQKKKKKKKEKPKSNALGGIIVVDEDPVWQKPVQIEEEIESSDEEKPQIDEDIEVKRMRRLEAIRARKAYHSISEDGSGWVPISNPVNPPLGSDDGDHDMSPPRKSRARFDTPSPQREGKMSALDSDISPPRQRQRRADTPSPSPTRRGRRKDTPSRSPTRRGRHADTPSPSPTQRRRHADTPSPSPTRRARRADTPSPPPSQRWRRADTSYPSPKRPTGVSGNDWGNASPPWRERQPTEDISPPRRKRQLQTSGADISPPRSRKGVSDDLSPPPRRAEEANNLSPPRRRRDRSSNDVSPSRGSTKQLSPPRHLADRPADLSPPRRRQKVSSHEISPPPHSSSFASDLSPPRRSSKASAADFSPPRRRRSSPPVKLHESHASDLSPPRKNRNEAPLAKQRAGLFLSGKDFGEEINQKKKAESSRIAAMDPSKTGKGAEPVFRDKEGKIISKEEMSKSKEEKPKEKKLEWGKGLAQKREAEAMAEELEKESLKPFARTRDDPELDKMFKERIRWGDPMAHLVKRKDSELILEDLGDDEKMKDSGFIIPQTVPSHSWLKRGIDFPPNRYGIRPGRHWDGVDRSNGYEKELFKRQNEKRATEQEAYLWSVSDM